MVVVVAIRIFWKPSCSKKMVVVVEAIIRCVSRTTTIDNVVGSNRINTGKSIDIDATDHGC